MLARQKKSTSLRQLVLADDPFASLPSMETTTAGQIVSGANAFLFSPTTSSSSVESLAEAHEDRSTQSSASCPCGRIRSARRREQCRVNQARYRARKERQSTKLQASIVALQLEIQRLEYTHRSLYADWSSQETVIEQIALFGRLFRHGMHVAGSPLPSLLGDSGPGTHMAELTTQIAFLNQVITSNVRINDQIGRQHVMTHLLKLSGWFQDIQIDLIHTSSIPGCPPSSMMVRAEFVMTVIVSETLLRYLSSRFRSVDGTFLLGLLGRRVSAELVADIAFDANQQVVSIQWSIDTVSALSKLLPLHVIALLCTAPPNSATHHWISEICEKDEQKSVQLV